MVIARICRPSLLRACPAQQRTLPRPSRAGPSPPMRHARRGYLGGAGEMRSRRDAAAGEDAVARREQELWDRARPRYDAILERHVRLPTSEGGGGDDDAVRRKRLVYRAKQRGWLEVDLLLGTWASENVANLSAKELDSFEEFVNLETVDIYNVLTLRTDVPDDMRGSGGEKSLVEKIQDWARASPLGKADQERYAEAKAKNNLI
ncbi:hypothetical protein ACHAWF_016999 [Thalassiosira exigua]